MVALIYVCLFSISIPLSLSVTGYEWWYEMNKLLQHSSIPAVSLNDKEDPKLVDT